MLRERVSRTTRGMYHAISCESHVTLICCMYCTCKTFLSRAIFKEDIQLVKKATKKKEKSEQKGRGIKAASEGRKSGPPENSLSLAFVHG